MHACFHAALGDHPPRLVPLRDVVELAAVGFDVGVVVEFATIVRCEPVFRRAVHLVDAELGVRLEGPLPDWAPRLPAHTLRSLGAPRLRQRRPVLRRPGRRITVRHAHRSRSRLLRHRARVSHARLRARARGHVCPARGSGRASRTEVSAVMTENRVRFRTPWLDLFPGSGIAQPEKIGAPVWITAALVVFGLLVAIIVVMAVGGNREAYGLVITVPMLLLLTMLIARRLAIVDENPLLYPMIMAGLGLKLSGSFIRYWVASSFYGTGDFKDYDKWGRIISAGLHHGHLIGLRGRLAGTNFMRMVTGWIYFFTPAAHVVGLRRLQLAELHRDPLLLAGIPARRVTQARHHLSQVAAAAPFVALLAVVDRQGRVHAPRRRRRLVRSRVHPAQPDDVRDRRHVGRHRRHDHGPSALRACGLRRPRARDLDPADRGGFFRTVISLAFVIGLGAVVLQSASSFFGISAFNQSSIMKTLNDASAQSSEGGSVFTPVVVHSPARNSSRHGHRLVPTPALRGPFCPGDGHRTRGRGVDTPDDTRAALAYSDRCDTPRVGRTSCTRSEPCSSSSSRSRASRTSACWLASAG